MTDIPNIGSTNESTQLLVHVVHMDNSASIHPLINQQPSGITILIEDATDLVDDHTIAQAILLLTQCDPDTIDVRHMSTGDDNEKTD